MRVARRGKSQQMLQVDLAGRGAQQIASAHDLGDAHGSVVDHHGQLIGKNTIAAAHQKVAALGGERLALGAIRAVHEFNHIVCEVVDGRHAQARGRSAQDAATGNLLDRKVSAGAAVDGRAVAGVRRARGVEFGTRAKTGIGEAGVLQLAQGVLVQIQAIVLVVGAFVPLQSQPGQVVNQLSGKFRALAAIVQVLDAQHDAAVLAAGRKPCAQAAEHVAQVHAARGRRGKAAHDGGGGGGELAVGRRRRGHSGRCYVACVDIHADEYSAGRGGGDAAVACKLPRPRVARAGPPARQLDRRPPAQPLKRQKPRQLFATAGVSAEKGDMILERTAKGQTVFAQLLYAPRLAAQSAHAAPTQSRYTCDGAVKWYLSLPRAMPKSVPND